MLAMKTYNPDYIDACRTRVHADLRAYRNQVGKASSKEFEAHFFNDQALFLDYMFVHRLRGIEGKDGNPLNEVRVLCDSILLNQGKLQIDKLPGWPHSAGAPSRDQPESGLTPAAMVRPKRRLPLSLAPPSTSRHDYLPTVAGGSGEGCCAPPRGSAACCS